MLVAEITCACKYRQPFSLYKVLTGWQQPSLFANSHIPSIYLWLGRSVWAWTQSFCCQHVNTLCRLSSSLYSHALVIPAPRVWLLLLESGAGCLKNPTFSGFFIAVLTNFYLEIFSLILCTLLHLSARAVFWFESWEQSYFEAAWQVLKKNVITFCQCPPWQWAIFFFFSFLASFRKKWKKGNVKL